MAEIESGERKRQRLSVVIVTFNRLPDLQRTVAAFLCQRRYIWRLLIVDNCSTDGTREYLLGLEAELPELIAVHRTDENRGGAGGFSIGVEIARQWPVDWIFLTDDDALPRQDCVGNLLAHAFSQEHIFGCIAVNRDDDKERLCWPINVERILEGRKRTLMLESRLDMREVESVPLIPFLGFLVSRERANEVALPNANYFISGDDVEYGIRLRKAGAHLYQVREAVMEHPAIPRYYVSLTGRRFHCLRMAPWRRFYDVRNRIWNSRLDRGRGGGLYTAATLILRLAFTLIFERDRLGQLRAYSTGIYEGLARFDKSGSSSGTSEAAGEARREPAG